jgi:hypothetical protein
MAQNKTTTKDDRRGGFYWVDNTPYVSVTNILKVIDKPALRRWAAKETYLAMVKDPTLSEQEALSMPYMKTKAGAERGSAIHSLVEAWEKTQKVIESVPQNYRLYAQAFYKWTRDNNLDLQEHEKTVISKEHRYAGTLDLIVKKGQGELWIVDIKTGRDIYLESHLQLSAYKHALSEDFGMDIGRMGVLLLKETGNYKFEEVDDYFDVFMACKKLWEFINREDCEKVGYL